ncbi:urease accessory protein UreE [Dongia soli]|uniref:Urease accessory protein UreE n=2 Tax=Dongia soli TaxID=600628 RepID=A0ABU5ECX2_9PROT|nr:urease accessory protein UreE [Dongia soli]
MAEKPVSTNAEPLRLDTILGLLSEPAMADHIHDVGHHGVVEYIDLGGDDIRRHRLRVTTDQGTDCAISLPRNQHLQNGAVLLAEKNRAIVVRMLAREWLRVEPKDAAAALELGYFAGNMHWPVRFESGLLLVELQGPQRRYLDRLDFMVTAGQIRILEAAA